MALIWAEILKYVFSISWRAWARAVVILVVFIGGCTFGFNCARGDEPKSCPVNGNQCPCGCRGGQQCNCAKPDPGFVAYSDLCHLLKPGDRFEVYVGVNVPRVRALQAVRWDEYPGVSGPAIISHFIGADGKPYREAAVCRSCL